jgi:FtsP/CotA-like multicopper oxidase with cupredoxin domain
VVLCRVTASGGVSPHPSLPLHSRFFEIFFEISDGTQSVDNTTVKQHVPFTVVGNDQGLLGNPVTVTELFMGPAERYEILISFKDLPNQTVTLRNRAPTLIGPGEWCFVLVKPSLSCNRSTARSF